MWVCAKMMDVWLVWLVRVAWVAATLLLVVGSLPSSRLRTVHDALMGFFKRGKTMQPSSTNRFTVPQRWFSHFYVLAVVWTTLLLSLTWMYAYKMAPLASEPSIYPTLASHLTGGSHMHSFHKSCLTPLEHRNNIWHSVFLLLLMEIQVVRRLFESFYVFKYSPCARMHIFCYLTGMAYYILAPLSLCCSLAPELYRFAVEQGVESAIKKKQMAEPDFEWWEFVNPLMNLGWLQWIGAAIFLWGWIHQRLCHVILGSLREHSKQINEYAIPHGDWFELVSSPHYLAEIVIYAGLLVASGGTDLTIWLLFVVVVANLSFTAAETQRWYLQKFENYPRNRRAIIPFIY